VRALRTRRTSGAVAALAVVVALSLSGCGSSQAGQAAVVGSQTVSDTDITSTVDSVHTQLLSDKTNGAQNAVNWDERKATAAAVNRLTRRLLLAEAAKDQGITVTQAQVDDLIATTIKDSFQGDQKAFENALAAQYLVPADEIPLFARDVLITQGLQAKLAPGASATEATNKTDAYLEQLGRGLGIEVSPRFGTWSYKASTIDDTLPNDLSVPQKSGASSAPAPAGSTAPSAPAPSPSSS
jgi:hypothetical protein